MKILQVTLAALALAAAAPAFAKHGKEHKHDQGEQHEKHHGDGNSQGGDHFGNGERDQIGAWYSAHPEDRDALPPGLAKKGKVPPGWQKKFDRGQRIPDDVWEMRMPVPQEVVLKLPVPPPPDVVLVRIGSQILKVREKTHEVLDRIGLPHPP